MRMRNLQPICNQLLNINYCTFLARKWTGQSSYLKVTVAGVEAVYPGVLSLGVRVRNVRRLRR
jgi:hypothetical protein